MTFESLALADVRKAYEEGATPRDVIEHVIARIAAVDDPGIFIHTASRDELLAAANALGDFAPGHGPLWGVPFAVKDNIDVVGMPTTAACPDYSYEPEADAAVVALLKAAGAIVIGKANLDQFATGLVGTRTPYPIPKNAVAPDLVPGGSSSGSAVAVAQGIVSFALGTDTAGSGRVPAGLNEIVGLKPSLGALSTRGVVPACRTLDCVSVFARTVADAWTVFETAHAYDADDPYSRPVSLLPPASSKAPVVGVPRKQDRRFFDDETAAAAFEAALADLSGCGVTLREILFEDFYATADLLYGGAWVAERYAAIDDFIAAHPDALHPVTRQIIEGAKGLSAVDAFKGIYRLAEYRRKVQPVLDSVDALCVPTAPTHYTVAQVLDDPIATNSALGTYTNFVNLLGLCGLTVPARRRADGLPGSVTLLAKDGGDARLRAIALDFERRVSGGGEAPVTVSPQPAMSSPLERGVDLVVVGAHMSGLPLNGELTALGATFVREAETCPDYRLFDLVGSVPAKPGLLRVARGQGVAIGTEVWRLPAEGFGRLVAAIPAPLGIGTVRLADGTEAKGFLVEAEGIRSARDISEFGSWRSFLEVSAGSAARTG